MSVGLQTNTKLLSTSTNLSSRITFAIAQFPRSSKATDVRPTLSWCFCFLVLTSELVAFHSQQCAAAHVMYACARSSFIRPFTSFMSSRSEPSPELARDTHHLFVDTMVQYCTGHGLNVSPVHTTALPSLQRHAAEC
jgi:hypothetical protein